jgi:hypothetical protein
MQVIETVPVSDTYCSGVSRIEQLPCGNFRLWCYTAQASDCGTGPVENVLVAKLVMPALAPMVMMALGAIGDRQPELADLTNAAALPIHH